MFEEQMEEKFCSFFHRVYFKHFIKLFTLFAFVFYVHFTLYCMIGFSCVIHELLSCISSAFSWK